MVPAGIVYRVGDGLAAVPGGTVETLCGGCAVGAAGGRGICVGTCSRGTAAVYHTGAARAGVLLSGIPTPGTDDEGPGQRMARTGGIGRNGVGGAWRHPHGYGGAEGECEPAGLRASGGGGKLAGAVPERMAGEAEGGGAEKDALHAGKKFDVHLCRALAAAGTGIQSVWRGMGRGLEGGASLGGACTGIAADGLYSG